MDDMARAAFVISQAVCAMARIAAMQAENQHCALLGCSPVYNEEALNGVINEFGIGHNSVISYLQDGR